MERYRVSRKEREERDFKIKEKLAMDLDNPDIRLRLLLSMKILAILGKIPDWSSNPETGIEDVE